MPIVEKDPWRAQYFDGVACPSEVVIPTDDELAYTLYPRYRWVYNKLLICETQNISHAPHDIMPPRFPVFSKPIYNLRGMGTGGKVVHTAQEYEHAQAPGHMWMTLLEGQHVSSDVAMLAGEPVWWRHTIARPLPQGMFDYWIVLAEARPDLEGYCGAWLRTHLKGYSGCVNLETIAGKIIEAHLRLSDQWVDLYGPGWTQAVVELYARERWTFPDHERRAGYSVVLFGAHGRPYRRPETDRVRRLRHQPGVSSIQITFHEDKAPETHAMPPGGFRLAVVNCWDLNAGIAAREQLARHFSEQDLRQGKDRRR